MLNPDGVFSGNFRYDNLNQNLNRFYNNANIMEQPTIFATKTIIQKLANEKRLMYYFDIHAHHTPKGCYIYGNAFQDFIKQVQSKVFCRLMSLNSNQFQYSACNFSKLHMNYKERFDRYSKQGCGRVFAYKQNQMIHSFTVQCGYYKAIPHQKIQDSNKDFSINNLRRTQSSNNCKQIFTSQNFKEIGRNLMITILDSLELNPYSKIINSQFKDLFHIRKITSSEIFHQEERFRKFQINIAQKIRNVNAYIEELYEEWFASRKDFGLDGEFVRNKWPQCFKKLKIMNEKPKKQSQTNLRIIKLSKNLSTKQKQQKQQKQAEIVEPRISSELEEQKIQIQNIVAPGNNQLINFNFYDNSDSSLQKTIKKDPKKFYKKLSLTKNHKKTETAQFKSQGKFSVKTKLKTDADETQISSQFHIQLKQIKIQHKTDINNEINVSSKHAESLLNSKQIKTKRKSQLRNKKDNNSAPKKNPNLLQKQYKGTQYDDNIILRKRYENFKHLTEQNGIADSNNLIIKFPKIENLNSIKADIIRDLKKDNFCRNLYYRK